MSIDIDLNQKMCRVCLSTTSELRSIYRTGKLLNQKVKISDILSECLSLKFTENDGLPDSVCIDCLLKTTKIYAFRQLAFETNFHLRRKFRQDQPERKPIQLNQLMKPEHFESDENSEFLTVIVSNENGTETIATIPNDEDYQTVEMLEYVEDEESEMTSSDVNEPTIFNVVQIDSADDEEKSKKRYKCKLCGKLLSNRNSLNYHMQLHSEEKPFLCNECGESFKTRNAYDGHKTTHQPNSNQCKLCGKSYRQAASLRTHMLTHSGEKPFVCDICGKGMTQKSGFKKHMLLHTGLKPHTCDICGKKFRYSSNLICHKRSHNNERNYPCNLCEKRFIGSEQLKRHKTVHTGERPFSCDTCDKRFSRKGTLMAHEKTHAKDFICKVCNIKLPKDKSMEEHLRTAHIAKNDAKK